MSRSSWKGPFVAGYLIKKVEALRAKGEAHKVLIKTYARSSTIIPNFVGVTFSVYNGKKFIPVQVNEQMVGRKFGEFSLTRTFHGHKADKKAKRS